MFGRRRLEVGGVVKIAGERRKQGRDVMLCRMDEGLIVSSFLWWLSRVSLVD